MSVGERICLLRKQGHISQTQLAEALNVSRQAVSKWENDQSLPDTANMIRLADLLNTDIEFLSTGRIVPPPPPVTIEVTKTVDRVVEKVVEKPVDRVVEVVVEKPVDRVVEVVVEKPIVRKVTRVKYLRNPAEFLFVGVVSLFLGLIIGILIGIFLL